MDCSAAAAALIASLLLGGCVADQHPADQPAIESPDQVHQEKPVGSEPAEGGVPAIVPQYDDRWGHDDRFGREPRRGGRR